MLLICPVRPGDRNEELRYAVRSWETNLHPAQPGDERLILMTVGYKPDWLDPDVHVEGNPSKSMPVNVWENVRLGAQATVDQGLDSESVAYMNDDFFCLDPVGAILPVRRNMTLAEHASRASTGTWWGRSLALTASWLSEVGFPHPWSYEVHRPLLASPSGMIQAMDRWDRGLADGLPQWRTVYGVLNGIEAYPAVDAKLSTRSPGFGTPWVSTSDETWRRYALDVGKRFQKPSRWERDV